MRIATVAELLDLLDHLTPERSDATSRAAGDEWARIVTSPGHPLNTDAVDANLEAWATAGLLPQGRGLRALDVGCGLGRNARWLARQGWHVTGVDISARALEEARSRGAGDEQPVTFLELDILRDRLDCDGFDLVYDSGCFHHLAPHRRITYRESLTSMLRPGGLFGICTFTAGLMGSDEDDAALLVHGVLGDGIGYTVDDLTAIFSDLELLDAGAQQEHDGAAAHTFGQSFLTAALFRRRNDVDTGPAAEVRGL